MTRASTATGGLLVVILVVFLGELIAVLGNLAPFTPGFVLSGLLIVTGLVLMKKM